MLSEEIICSVKGFMDPEEGMRLYSLACEASTRGPCLEIGSYCGKSALYIGFACRSNNNTLYSIDHHRGSEEQQPGEEYFDPGLMDPVTLKIDTFRHFRQTITLAGLEETVVPIVSDSKTVARDWTTPLGMVFIDGGHAYESVLADYTLWSRHVMPGGYLVFHDIFTDPAKGGLAPWRVYTRACADAGYTECDMTKTLGVLKRA
ncbi:MAG: class I SAM-dependent methyltransferase [Desulfatirhabdiaceae bacterium]